jgi:hypothetical protein
MTVIEIHHPDQNLTGNFDGEDVAMSFRSAATVSSMRASHAMITVFSHVCALAGHSLGWNSNTGMAAIVLVIECSSLHQWRRPSPSA